MCHASGSAKTSPCWKAVTGKPPSSLACINQTKVFPPPRVFEVLTQPSPATTPKKKVPFKLIFFFSLIIHCSTEITFQFSTISEPIFSQQKLPSLSESSVTSLFLFVACMTVSWNGFTQTGSKATMISSTFVTTTRKIVSQWLWVHWLGNLKLYMVQVKIQFSLKFLNLGLSFHLLCLLTLIHELLGLGDKGNIQN